MSKPLLYDLGVSISAISLWLTPYPVSRAAGYSISLIFSIRAYYTGITLISKERKEDEKQAIGYEAETDFYDQLLGTNIDAALEIKTLEVENKMLARMIPLMHQKTQLEKQLQQVCPVHPEMTEQEREYAAKSAIDDAFVTSAPTQITEEDIRKEFPENLDATSWKAILKALQNGDTKAEIVKDILGNSKLASSYYELLKGKYL